MTCYVSTGSAVCEKLAALLGLRPLYVGAARLFITESLKATRCAFRYKKLVPIDVDADGTQNPVIELEKWFEIRMGAKTFGRRLYESHQL